MLYDMPALSVTEVNGLVKKLFDREPVMQNIMITGEISNFSGHYRSGHLYFSLKDENCAIKAVMFARQASGLRFVPENGMKVFAFGRVSAYERDGVYQLYVERMVPDGTGSLSVQFELLKKKLAEEGLFDPEKKKKLPSFPHRIGVITSPTGAAVQDIFTILGRRYPMAEIVFRPVSVQGSSAPGEMIAALREFTAKNCADVLIIGRGGGSLEDLWCFNDELLARAIYACPIPVISAVGHETDFTICDFVSDLRAPTPSAAAELAVPDIEALMMNMSVLTDRLYNAVNRKLEFEKKRLEAILGVRDFAAPGNFFQHEKLMNERLGERLRQAGNKLIADNRLLLSRNTAALESLNPLSVLLRGYAAVSVSDAIIESVERVSVGDDVEITMSDGKLLCKVTEKRREKIG